MLKLSFIQEPALPGPFYQFSQSTYPTYQGLTQCYKAVREDSMWHFRSPVIAHKPGSGGGSLYTLVMGGCRQQGVNAQSFSKKARSFSAKARSISQKGTVIFQKGTVVF